jgi:hypothetical protein
MGLGMSFVWRQSWYRSAAAVFLSASLSLGLVGCGSGGDLGPDPGIAPAIASQPASITADDGATASFNVTASGENLSYQWQRNGTNIPGATLAVYTTPTLALADSGAVYTVVITNTAGTATSNPATLTVVQAPARIATQPADTSVLDGSSATFSVALGAGTPPITYQWRRNGSPIAGATAASYTTPANTMSDTNTLYSVVVTAAGGTATSRDARLTVTARPPTMTTQPTNASSQYLTGAVFTAQASGTAPLTYQWLRNGIALSGETGTTLSLPSVNYGDDGARYAVVVTNAGGDITSQSGVLTVTPPPGTVQNVSSCITIGAPGAYRLTADIPPITVAGATCITINASNVQLDCNAHSLGATATNSSAISLGQVQNVSIKGCTIQTSRLFFDRVTNVTLHDNTFTAGSGLTAIEANQAVLLAVDNNTLTQGYFRQLYGRNVTVSNNRMTATAGASSLAGLVWSLFGTGTRVLSNTFDGRWNSDRGNLTQNGAHSGIVIQDESDVVLEGNSMTDIFASGIEFLGTLSGMTARDNRITNAGQFGFYGSTFFSMSSSRFVGNTIDRSAIAFQFNRRGGLRPVGYADPPDTSLPSADTAVVFRDITIERNTHSRALSADGTNVPPSVVVLPITVRMDYDSPAAPPLSEPTAGAFQLGNVRFANNTFDFTAGAPMEFGQGAFTPGLIVDGGGNRCPRSSQPGFPIACAN